MHSSSFSSAEGPYPQDYAPMRICRDVDQFSQAVLSFMYEVGLLIVSDADSVVTVVPEGALASCHEVVAYDEPAENESAVEALKSLQAEGFTECSRDDTGRHLYRLSFKGRVTAQSLRFRQRP